ncbi:MAG: hypothetical protein Q9157_001670 [Trypethelium eluteriae]
MVEDVSRINAQFMPSSTHTAEKILGIPIDTIRTHCDTLAIRLHKISEQVDGPKSLVCVQYLLYHVCYLKNEGLMRDAWYTLGSTVRIVQDLDIRLEESSRLQQPMDNLEKELRRRAFCNLYICDRFLSLFLGRLPCIPEDHFNEMSKIRLISGSLSKFNIPDPFTGRLLQAKLCKLCFAEGVMDSIKSGHYDPSRIEEVYERLHQQFVDQLPSQFDLHIPDLQWDEKLPMLSRQRQTLRISVFAILCQLFQPLLHLAPEHIQTMLQYEQDLVWKHHNYLVNATVSLLESVSQLHGLMGGNTNRFFLLSFFTFEPAMLLAMCLMSTFTSHKILAEGQLRNKRTSLFHTQISPRRTFTATQCRAHIIKALERLTLLQETNRIAKTGTQKLKEVLPKLDALLSDSQLHCLAASSRVSINETSNSHMKGNSWLGFEMVENAAHDCSALDVYPTDLGVDSSPRSSERIDLPPFPSEGSQWPATDAAANYSSGQSCDIMSGLALNDIGTSRPCSDPSSPGLNSGVCESVLPHTASCSPQYELDPESVVLEQWFDLCNAN